MFKHRSRNTVQENNGRFITIIFIIIIHFMV
jgi:hypothetical protein